MLHKADPTQSIWSQHEQEMAITIKGKGRIVFKSGDNPDSLYGEDVFAAVVDEASRCFVAGTLVDTPSGPRPIESIREGDLVCNASGIGKVRRTIRKTSRSVAVVKANGYTMVSSVDHRYLTQRGWVEAMDLDPEKDLLVGHSEAVRALREDVFPASDQAEPTVLLPQVLGEWDQGPHGDEAVRTMPRALYRKDQPLPYSFLRAELRREMENVHAGDKGGHLVRRVTGQVQRVPQGVLGQRHAVYAAESQADSGLEHDAHSRSASKGVRDHEGTRAQAAGSWRARCGHDRSPVHAVECVGRRVRARDEHPNRKWRLLLDRHCQQSEADCDRVGREIAPDNEPQRVGREEDRTPRIARVESVEILESRSDGFSAVSGGSDSVRLYDLSVSGHPSFCVNGFVVHNCKETAWHALRSTLTATGGPARIIGNVRGRKNWAYQMARRAEAGATGMHYAKITCADAVEAGLIPQSEIEQAKMDLPDWVFRELYLSEPSEDGANPFGIQHIAACVCPLSTKPPVVFGVDLAKSVDWTVVIGLDDEGKVCVFDRWQRVPWQETQQRILRIIGDTRTLVDSTGVGDAILEDLSRASPYVEGLKFSNHSKQQMMEGLAVGIQSGRIGFPDGIIRNELDEFEFVITERTGRVMYSAPSGAHDDCVCALALAYRHANLGSYDISARVITTRYTDVAKPDRDQFDADTAAEERAAMLAFEHGDS